MISLSAVMEQAEAHAAAWERQGAEHRRAFASRFDKVPQWEAAQMFTPATMQDELDAGKLCDAKAATVREFARAVAQSAGVVA